MALKRVHCRPLHVKMSRLARRVVQVSSFLLAVVPAAVGCTTTTDRSAEESSSITFTWDALPDLPRALGGQMSGSSHGALIVAGGTDFPKPLAEGGAKVWYDTIHLLAPGATAWSTPSALPSPLAYAAVAVASDRVLIAGGSDAARHHVDVHALEWTNGTLRITDLPPLPRAVAMAGGAAIGRVFYVAGGHAAPDAADASRVVLALDLDAPQRGWRELPPLPGPGRILPVVVAQASQLIVASGAALSAGVDGRLVRQSLIDAYAWTPDTTTGGDLARGSWRPIADVPRPVIAAPSAPLGSSHIVVFGGDDGSLAAQAAELGDRHPGFSREILAYDIATNTWTAVGALSRSLVTTTAALVGSAIAITGGEDRPGHRSASVPLGRPVRTGVPSTDEP